MQAVIQKCKDAEKSWRKTPRLLNAPVARSAFAAAAGDQIIQPCKERAADECINEPADESDECADYRHVIPWIKTNKKVEPWLPPRKRRERQNERPNAEHDAPQNAARKCECFHRKLHKENGLKNLLVL